MKIFEQLTTLWNGIMNLSQVFVCVCLSLALINSEFFYFGIFRRIACVLHWIIFWITWEWIWSVCIFFRVSEIVINEYLAHVFTIRHLQKIIYSSENRSECRLLENERISTANKILIPILLDFKCDFSFSSIEGSTPSRCEHKNPRMEKKGKSKSKVEKNESEWCANNNVICSTFTIHAVHWILVLV